MCDWQDLISAVGRVDLIATRNDSISYRSTRPDRFRLRSKVDSSTTHIRFDSISDHSRFVH